MTPCLVLILQVHREACIPLLKALLLKRPYILFPQPVFLLNLHILNFLTNLYMPYLQRSN